MGIRLAKPWRALAERVDVHGHLGVFELADADGRVLFIGFAGGLSPHGLRGELDAAIQAHPSAAAFRLEINTSYLTRYRELLMAHVADHDDLPPGNPPMVGLGRLSPA